MHCTHTFPSTITPITQLSPLTHQPWLPHHTCTSFTHSHKSSTQTLTQCEVLFPPGYISERFSQFVFPCTTWTVDLLSWSFAACLSDLACFMVILSVCRLPCPIALPLISTLPFLRCPRYLCLIFACLTLYNKAASGSTLASDLSFVTEDFAKDESSSKVDVTPPGYKVHWGLCRGLPRTGTPDSSWQDLLNDIFSWGLIRTSSLNHAAAWS